MKKTITLAALLFSAFSFSQVGIGTASPNASAALDVTSTTRGFLPPRMTFVQKIAITTPPAGLIVWCTNCGTNGEMQVYNGVDWINFSGTAGVSIPGAPTSPVATVGNTLASVAFTAPASNGGSAITGYSVTSSPGGFTATGVSSPLTVTGLTNGTSYTFTVVATNAVGNSVASEPSAPSAPSASCGAFVASGVYKTFACYNLGVTGTQDPLSYQSGANNGALYQWGRKTDGHEVRTSVTQAGPVGAPVANKFITISVSSSPFDWISPQNNSLWLNASKTANDPCPTGFRVPTQAQWGGLFIGGTTYGAPNTATRNIWTWTGNGYTVGFALYLPAAGCRIGTNATFSPVGTYGYYWSSTVSGTDAYNLTFNSDSVSPGWNYSRSYGLSVRCIQE